MPNDPFIDPAALSSLGPVRYLDARDQAAFDAGHAPNAVRAPVDAWDKAIKTAALEERLLRHAARQEAAERPAKCRLKTDAKARVLLSFLIDHHHAQQRKGPMVPLTQVEISDIMTERAGEGWSQSTVQRLMTGVLFPKEGMDEYVQLCGRGKINRGLLYRKDDGTTVVEAISDDDDEDEVEEDE